MLVDRVAMQTAVEGVEPDLEFESLLRENYRGKGEAKEGFGLVYPTSQWIQEFFVQLAIFDGVVATRLVRDAKHDQMGKGYIAYFPGWKLTIL